MKRWQSSKSRDVKRRIPSMAVPQQKT